MSRAAFGETEMRRSRKERGCDWCDERINAGEMYGHWRGVYDGGPSTFDTHPECHEAVQRSFVQFDYNYDEGAMPPEHSGHKRGHTYGESEECFLGEATCPVAANL